MTTKELIELLEQTFDGNPWYGNSVIKNLEKIQDCDPNNSFKKGNSIGQILEHMIAWRIFTIEKLKGNSEYLVEMNSKDDWNKEGNYSDTDCQRLIDKLKETQKELISLIKKKSSDAWLSEKVPGSKYHFHYLLNGIIQHDIYHVGQIAILARN